ncbi:hypothetical protein [Rhodanobacter sp. MP1X3]|jgi:hypothetical protein|uniref:hypothetical protein n=1 Tax=Rhodanobacter sp. MP1X3 TaxID=2723086 RepID=UPI0016186AAA|nr:hypothetical protein [Rhodanobacter sp. MP1X3]MBB6244821.1 hypothetical protein [Rhodanobacter sp. MP1X3]
MSATSYPPSSDYPGSFDAIECGAIAELNAHEAMLCGDLDAEAQWRELAEAYYRTAMLELPQ